jgi:hypothetical protein
MGMSIYDNAVGKANVYVLELRCVGVPVGGVTDFHFYM